MKKLINFLFHKFCLKKHKFGRTDIIKRRNNSTIKAEVVDRFYDKELRPMYQIRPYGAKMDFIVDDGGPSFAEWVIDNGIAPGTVEMAAGREINPEAAVQIEKAKK